MKKIIAALAILLILASCKKEQAEKGNLHITGNVEGLKSGTVYIRKLEDTTLVLLDSIRIEGNSEFKSDLTLESPEMLYLYLDRGVTNNMDDNLMFFAEPGNINIDTNLETFYANAKVTGSKNHELYDEFKKVKSRFVNQGLDLTLAAYKSYAKKDSITDYQAKADDITKRKYLYAINFALNHNDYDVAPYIALSEIPDANIKYLDTINNSLPKKVAQAKYGRMLSELIASRKKAEN